MLRNKPNMSLFTSPGIKISRHHIPRNVDAGENVRIQISRNHIIKIFIDCEELVEKMRLEHVHDNWNFRING